MYNLYPFFDPMIWEHGKWVLGPPNQFDPRAAPFILDLKHKLDRVSQPTILDHLSKDRLDGTTT